MTFFANDEQVARRSIIETGYWETVIPFDPNTISAVLARGLRFWIPGSVGPETTKNYRNWSLEVAWRSGQSGHPGQNVAAPTPGLCGPWSSPASLSESIRR
jgi:hypothetical protein